MAAAEDQNKGPEPRLLKSGLRRDSGTQQRFPSGKPTRGPQVPKSVLLIRLRAQRREALEGAQQKDRVGE